MAISRSGLWGMAMEGLAANAEFSVPWSGVTQD